MAPFSLDINEPLTLGEAKVRFAQGFKDNHFSPTNMTVNRNPGSAGTDLTFIFTGTVHPPGEDASDGSLTFTETIPPDAEIIADGKEETNNPDRYQWHVERRHDKSGVTTLTAVGERVTAYLHHGSLDTEPHARFSAPESDPDFYYTSTFAPP